MISCGLPILSQAMPPADKTRIAMIGVIVLAMALAQGLGDAEAAESAPSPTPTRLVIGESLLEVESALNVTPSASSTPTASGLPETEFRLQARGIWVFLGPDNKALQYRFDAPFAGAIHGVKLGNTIAQTRAVLGAPTRPIPNVLSGQAFFYQLQDGIGIRCDFDNTGTLRTIRVLGGAISFDEPRREITRLEIAGNLAQTHQLDCIALDGVDSAFTPPDLYAAIPRCLAANRYADAVALFALAGAEASFDALRVTDKTAGQARQVLIMNTFNPLPPEQRQKFNDEYQKTLADPQVLAALCNRVRQFAPPSYYPRYMILHGIKAFTGDPYQDALDTNFDAKSSWIQVQRTYLNCAISE